MSSRQVSVDPPPPQPRDPGAPPRASTRGRRGPAPPRPANAPVKQQARGSSQTTGVGSRAPSCQTFGSPALVSSPGAGGLAWRLSPSGGAIALCLLQTGLCAERERERQRAREVCGRFSGWGTSSLVFLSGGRSRPGADRRVGATTGAGGDAGAAWRGKTNGKQISVEGRRRRRPARRGRRRGAGGRGEASALRSRREGNWGQGDRVRVEPGGAGRGGE